MRKRPPPAANNGAVTGGLFDAAVPVADMPVTGLRFLVFGASGTGKTTLACDFPKPLLLLQPEEAEDGSASVRNVPGVFVPPYLTEPDQLSEICDRQRQTGKYKTLVLDGVGNFQSLCVKKHMGFADVPVQTTWGMVNQPDWNAIGLILQELLRELVRLSNEGVNVVFVADERTIGADKEGVATEIMVPTVMAALTPASSGWLHRTCNYNVHCFKRQKTEQLKVNVGGKDKVRSVPGKGADYCLHVGPDSNFATKFRCPKHTKLPHVVVDPTYAKLAGLIKGV